MRKVISWKEAKKLVEAGKFQVDKKHDDYVDVFILSNRGHDISASILTPGRDADGNPVLRTGARSEVKNLLECNSNQKILVLYFTGPSANRGRSIVKVKNLKFEIYGYEKIKEKQ